jgi:hypothetical protein
MVDDTADTLRLKFDEIFVSPRLQPDKYYCLDFKMIPGKYWLKHQS